MASEDQRRTQELLTLSDHTSRRLVGLFALVGAAALVGGVLLAMYFGSGIEGSRGGIRRFFLGYLTAFGFVLSIALGGLFFVMLQHVTRSGWSVTVRRIPEALANTTPALAVLAIPILATLVFPGVSGSPTLYPWAVGERPQEQEHTAEVIAEPPVQADAPAEAPAPVPTGGRSPMQAEGQQLPDSPLLTREALTVEHARDHLEYTPLTAKKVRWLNRPFFALRILIYFGVWIAIAAFYWRNSVLQDSTADPALTSKMQKWAPACILAFAATVTGAAFDLWMSIDPHFYSTIWAVYIFAGGVIGALAVTILVHEMLQKGGLLQGSIGREHFHDLGKLLFAFVFFWGYIAFSQFMLIWYANIPETTYWFGVRGATTVEANHGLGEWPALASAPAPVGWWTIVVTILLFAHLFIPFAGLLSRHVKRNLTALGFWASWMLVMHYLDQYWLIMPEAMVGGWRVWPLPELATLLFMISAVGGYFVWTLSRAALRPAADPRLHESLAFHNI